MDIYVPLSHEGFELCQPEKQEDFEVIDSLIDGTPRQKTWRLIPMRLIHHDEGKNLSPSDSPWLGSHALIFKRAVIERLGKILKQYGELLPVVCPEAELLIFNPTRVVDALDEQASSVLRFSGGRIMLVDRYVFRAEAIANVDIFKIPNLRVSPTFMSERIVELWRTTGLQGLDFNKVWPRG